MPTLGGCNPNPDCSQKAVYIIGKFRGCNGKHFNHRSGIWYLCEEHYKKARGQYSTAYWSGFKKI